MPAEINPRILIVGTGSMACLFAARLSASGLPVTMLGSWQAGLEALRSYGVRLVESNGSENYYPVLVTNQLEDCIGSKWALVLVKAWGTARAARQLGECLALDGLALTLQNGLGNLEILADELGDARVALGVTTYGANLIEPGLVRSAGEGVISLTTSPKVEALGRILGEVGFNIEYNNDPSALIWSKLVVNASINPLTALLNVPNGELLELPSARALMGNIALETTRIAGALGIHLPYHESVKIIEDVAGRTADNISSMLQDIRRGTPTEIEAINGAIVREADKLGEAAPVNRTIWQLVKAKEGRLK